MTILGAPLVAWGDLGNVVLVGFAGGGLVFTWGLLLLGSNGSKRCAPVNAPGRACSSATGRWR
jgi:hypothetical protein